MRTLLSTAVVAVLLAWPPAPARADDVINVRVSIKVILSLTGQLPQGVNIARLNAIVLSDLNGLSQEYWRGYRFQLVGGIQTIGGPGAPRGPSQWYDATIQVCPGIRNAALADQGAYAWDPTAINVYITNGDRPGQALGQAAVLCPFRLSDPVIVVERVSAERGIDYFHEIGHYFGLCHTQGCGCPGCPRDPQGNILQTGVCFTEPGDDQIADTLAEAACWDGDQLAQYHFGTSVTNLTPADQERVLDVVQNVLSYRFVRARLTEGQLDVWADYASTMYNHVADGRTYFVAPDGSGSGTGRSTDPVDTVANGVALASPDGGDIVLLRPGVYPDTLTVDRPVTLRATRAGPAVIGRPPAPPP